ncbi:hypothetical protein BDP27DRAFT_1371776, partial [Rhodocollybia butyracea]
MLNDENTKICRQQSRISELESYSKKIVEAILTFPTENSVVLDKQELLRDPDALLSTLQENENNHRSAIEAVNKKLANQNAELERLHEVETAHSSTLVEVKDLQGAHSAANKELTRLKNNSGTLKDIQNENLKKQLEIQRLEKEVTHLRVHFMWKFIISKAELISLKAKGRADAGTPPVLSGTPTSRNPDHEMQDVEGIGSTPSQAMQTSSAPQNH